MLIRVPILLIWTWIDQISTWIEQIRLENNFEKNDFKLLAVSFVVIVSINLIRIRIVKSIRGEEPVPAAKTSVQTNCQRDATCPIIEEIKSTDDQDDQDDDINDQYEDEDNEEDAQNKTASKSDSGVGTIIQSVSNCTIKTSPGKMSRWQELIEEGEVLNRQKFDMEPKEWVRKKRLVFGILPGSATDETGASSMSPMTKHLFKRK